MDSQQIIDLMRLKLEAARDLNTGRITEEQYVGIHNLGAMLTNEARQLVPGRIISGANSLAPIRENTLAALGPRGNAKKKRGK